MTANIYRALRARGLSPMGAWRTLKRGDDAVALAIEIRDCLGQDGATALLAGLIGAPYGAQRAVAVLRRVVTGNEIPFPTRRVGWGVHAGAFRALLRRALKAVPHVGDAPEDVPGSAKEALKAVKDTISVMVNHSPLKWEACRH